MLYDRTAAAVLLVLFAGLHSVILLSSGINFWKWVVADLALAGFVWTMPEAAAQAVFTPEHLALSVVIMATQAVHLKCVELGWLDTRLTSAFRIEVVGVSGRSYRLSPGAMAPFDMVFAQHRHYHFCPFKTLTNTYGTLYARGKRGWAKYRAIEASQGRQPAHEQVRREHGFSHTDELRSREFERFMRCVMPELTRRAGARDWWSFVAAPRHIYVGASGDEWRAQEPAERVRIWFEENWYDGQCVREVNRALVRDILVSAGQPVVRPMSVPAVIPAVNPTVHAQVA